MNLRQPCVMALLPAARFNWFATIHRWQRRMAFPRLHFERDSVPAKITTRSGSPLGCNLNFAEKLGKPLQVGAKGGQ